MRPGRPRPGREHPLRLPLGPGRGPGWRTPGRHGRRRGGPRGGRPPRGRGRGSPPRRRPLPAPGPGPPPAAAWTPSPWPAPGAGRPAAGPRARRARPRRKWPHAGERPDRVRPPHQETTPRGLPLDATWGALACAADMDPQPSAPPVVAVVVASEQGDWFEETLASLGAQDYPNQSVLVVDGGDGTDPALRVAAVLPDAYLRRPASRRGFAALANDALETVRGSAFLVFCHDDVAPAPDAVRLMVEEALRSNAGIVGPKLVDWDEESRLLDVGLAVDKTGAAASLVDRGELDQEQHDGVRDVFAVPDACMLVRSDLFLAVGGFDPNLGDHGVDVDLCWRAQVVGARVMVAPAARVRHREGGREAPGVDTDRHRMEARNHLRTMLKSYSPVHLVRVVPQAAVVSMVETVIALFTRRWSQARDVAGAWLWNLHHLKALRGDRKAVQKSRTVPDSEVRRLQVRASVRMSAFL